jgi:WD40 repeat protein
VWNLASQTGAALEGRTTSYNCITDSIDGRRVAAGAEDGTIRIWDLTSRQEVAVLRGHIQEVLSLAFLPDGNSLVSISRDAVRLWRAASLAEIDAQDGAKRGK